MNCCVVNPQDSEKRTPLHAAAYLGDAEIIELLILSGMKGHFLQKHSEWAGRTQTSSIVTEISARFINRPILW